MDDACKVSGRLFQTCGLKTAKHHDPNVTILVLVQISTCCCDWVILVEVEWSRSDLAVVVMDRRWVTRFGSSCQLWYEAFGASGIASDPNLICTTENSPNLHTGRLESTNWREHDNYEGLIVILHCHLCRYCDLHCSNNNNIQDNQIKSNLFQATRPIAQTQMTIKHTHTHIHTHRNM